MFQYLETHLMSAESVRLIREGIAFSVKVEDREHSCLISDGALQHLYAFEGTTLDFLHVYRAYETRIHGVARQLILNGKAEPLLVLMATHFH
jgi:hypothetical protein